MHWPVISSPVWSNILIAILYLICLFWTEIHCCLFAHQGCIYLIKSTVKPVIFWNIITIYSNCFLFTFILKCNLYLWCKAEILASLLSLQCHMILQKSFADLLLKKPVENSFYGNNYIFFRNIGWIESSKEQHLFAIEIFCNMSLYCTYDQFNASLLNKSINFIQPLNSSIS